MSKKIDEGLLSDLKWRGLIAQSTEFSELETALKKPISLYAGFDPTAPSLHIGNLVVILVLKRFQIAGHTPIPLVGGATGLVGDPSGKNEERSLNDEKTVSDWVKKIRTQLERYLDFGLGEKNINNENSAVMANNLDWTKPVSALELLRDIGKHFSVNQMLAKDSVSSRLSAGGISYTEFSYQVLQALDYFELFRRNGCKLQIGGSDQWGNIVAGLELIRKVTGESCHALTVPLLTKADGSKFGKTATGTVWLDPDLTSPYEFYQYWINTEDADIEKFIKVFSFKSHAQIDALIREFKENPGARAAQRELAKELTTLVHGEKNCQQAEAASKALFGQGEISNLEATTLASALSQLPKVSLKKSDLTNGAFPSWVDLIVQSGVVDSKSAARRIIKEGGAYLNNERVTDEGFIPETKHLLHSRFLVLRKGKRDLAGVELS
jgi:tyrosyl-tRNA synthetase